jgi:importin subunit beta-1
MQSNEVDDESWNPAMAAATSLDLFARTVKDDIVPYVMPWVGKNIQDTTNWHNREAATLAFGESFTLPYRRCLLLGCPLTGPPVVKQAPFWMDRRRKRSPRS